MLTLLALLACAPEATTPEEDAYAGCIAMFDAWCECQPDVCLDLTAEEQCAGYLLLTCTP